VLAGTLVPVVSLFTTWFGGYSVSHRASQKAPQELTKWQKVANDTSNPLTLPLTLRRGRHKPLTITGGAQEQSLTLANTSKLL
jgi:hypothetical protein